MKPTLKVKDIIGAIEEFALSPIRKNGITAVCASARKGMMCIP